MGRDLGRKICGLRKLKGLSQSELAQKAGVAQSTLSYLESGKKMPQFDTLSAICKGLGVSVFELLTYDVQKSTKSWPLQQTAHMQREGSLETVPQNISIDFLKQFYEQKYLNPKAEVPSGP